MRAEVGATERVGPIGPRGKRRLNRDSAAWETAGEVSERNAKEMLPALTSWSNRRPRKGGQGMNQVCYAGVFAENWLVTGERGT
jgi:hypothetical protein